MLKQMQYRVSVNFGTLSKSAREVAMGSKDDITNQRISDYL